MPIVTNDTLETVFQHHRPTPVQAKRYEALRAYAKNIATCLLNLQGPPSSSGATKKVWEPALLLAWTQFSGTIAEVCPGVHERALALNNLSDAMGTPNHQRKMVCVRQALMWANAAIACNEPDADAQEADPGPAR